MVANTHVHAVAEGLLVFKISCTLVKFNSCPLIQKRRLRQLHALSQPTAIALGIIKIIYL